MPDKIAPLYLANTILKIAWKNSIDVNPMKLQRLLYLTFAKYLQKTGKPLFTENWQVWYYGPVCQSVYWKFQCYRTRPIAKYGQNALGNVTTVDLSTDTTLRHVLSDIETLFLNKSAKELSEVVRMPGSAWNRAFQNDKDTLKPFDIETDCCVS